MTYSGLPRSTSGRLYEKEAGPPDVQCLSYTHDRDYGAFK